MTWQAWLKNRMRFERGQKLIAEIRRMFSKGDETL